jgi:two-component system OmpR family response regulator
MRILLVSGIHREADAICRGLRGYGYAVDVAQTRDEAAAQAQEGDYDAIVAESQDESSLDALEVTRRLRGADVGEPLLVVAEEMSEQRAIEAFDAGADQVMDQERGFEELLARVRGLLRQCKASPGNSLTYRDVEMDLTKMTVHRAGQSLDLIGKPFALLEYFLRRAEEVCDRESIGFSVWDQNFDPFSNVIDVTVSKVRQQLDRPFETPYLHTVVGKGYVLSEAAPGKSRQGSDDLESSPPGEGRRAEPDPSADAGTPRATDLRPAAE